MKNMHAYYNQDCCCQIKDSLLLVEADLTGGRAYPRLLTVVVLLSFRFLMRYFSYWCFQLDYQK